MDGVREIEEKNYSLDCVAADPESSDPAMRLAQLFPREQLGLRYEVLKRKTAELHLKGSIFLKLHGAVGAFRRSASKISNEASKKILIDEAELPFKRTSAS